ncbi:glycosyltransferase family 4 protein [Mesoflavibacter sp. SCSIO 43206]|jgi:glycosyltransferase involved in cell wall biosynthesis|uniref:glycosyltransferase family 4 protein n=1 Tax=Mesoflavibacter sp. SCSIO 43206 TaxID=2779362 RepID=UPI001CA85332|nr:glycosyltransferase family 4 protein [Mesoflavibacter sp. SCSIO 43206]UAB74722.1 glycosyltransferase family 4 protein [Mesoflavibacter sp. SCSIO 43206]
MKNIAMICNYILRPDRIGGMDRFFKLFDAQLKERGYQVDWFFTTSTAFDFYKDLKVYSIENALVEHTFLEIGKEKTYDIVITHFTELCTKFYKKVHLQHPKACILAVDHNPRPLEGYPLKKRLKKRIKSFLYAKYIHQFIAVSAYSKQHLISDFGTHIAKRIKIIHNGIELGNYIEKKDYCIKKEFIVACHLRKEKGIQYLIKALTQLTLEEKKDLKIDVYGEGPYEEELKKMVEDYELTKVINFRGSVSNLYEIYYKYDYLIHPSLGETYCYSVVEALLCKLPVITTTHAGNVLGLVKDSKNGFLFLEKDVTRITELLKNILSETLFISEEAFNSVEIPNFTLQKMVNEHLNLLPCI